MTDQELNEAVARKLGWIYTPPPAISEMLPICWTRPNGEPSHYLPNFSGSIQAAWEIVEHFDDKWLVSLYNDRGHWGCAIFHGNVQSNPSDNRIGKGQADTAPRAICEAFLKLP